MKFSRLFQLCNLKVPHIVIWCSLFGSKGYRNHLRKPILSNPQVTYFHAEDRLLLPDGLMEYKFKDV